MNDGCAAQFRSCFVFKLFSTYRLAYLAWHYNEAHRGKGPMDGISGIIKNVVSCQVKSGQIIINSAEDFCRAANQFSPSITALFQKSDMILSELVILKKHQLYQEHLRLTSSHNFLPLQPEKSKSIFSSYRITRDLVVPKVLHQKKMRTRRPWFRFSRAI